MKTFKVCLFVATVSAIEKTPKDLGSDPFSTDNATKAVRSVKPKELAQNLAYEQKNESKNCYLTGQPP